MMDGFFPGAGIAAMVLFLGWMFTTHTNHVYPGEIKIANDYCATRGGFKKMDAIWSSYGPDKIRVYCEDDAVREFQLQVDANGNVIQKN